MRLSILITCIFVSAISLNAQKKLNLHANIGTGMYGFVKDQTINYSPTYRVTENYQAQAGASLGIELAYTINPKWRLSSGINYQFFQLKRTDNHETLRNGKFEQSFASGNRNKHQKLQALQLPLQCSFFVLDKKNKLSIDLGFITSWMMAYNFNFHDEEVSPLSPQVDGPFTQGGNPVYFDRRISFLVTSGITFKPFEYMAFRLSYEHNLVDNAIYRSFFDLNNFYVNDYFELNTNGIEFAMIYQLTGKGKNSL